MLNSRFNTCSGEVASKEYKMELSLHKMESDWDSVSFVIRMHKNKTTFILGPVDEVRLQSGLSIGATIDA